MAKKIILSVVALLLVVGVIGTAKALQITALIESGENYVPPPDAVSAQEVEKATWKDTRTSVGTVVALQGITLSAEAPGLVRELRFESGQTVKKGELLVRLDIGVEAAQLAAAQAQQSLAEVSLDRTKGLQSAGAIAAQELDAARAQALQTSAQVRNVSAVLQKKAIVAPFDGRVGIRQVDVGAYVAPGTPIVTLQDLTSVYVDFRLPQREIGALSQDGIVVNIKSDAFEGDPMRGTISVVDTAVDVATRNIQVRAIVPNPDEKLKPGMFVNVELVMPTENDFLIIPATSVQYAPYGDSVYVVQDATEDNPSPKSGKIAKQSFVRLGARKGDLVAVLSGLEEGQTVVTSGGFKLRDGSPVVVNNELAPDANAAPTPKDR